MFDFVTELAVALVMGAIGILAWGFKPFLDKDVSLKIKNPRVETSDLGTKDEFKRLLFDIENNGKVEAKGCRAKIKVVSNWDEYETLLPDFPSTIETFNILGKDKCSVFLCKVEKKHRTTTVIHIAKYPALTKGIYEIEICIVGENLANGKTHKLKLNLSSWENIGIILNKKR